MTSIRQALVLLAAVAVTLALSASAGAADGLDPDPPPPPIKEPPNLVLSAASVAPYGTSQWEIRYTVASRGTLAPPAFHVTVHQNGTTLVKDTTYASLAAGTSRSEVIHIARTRCYISLRFVADSTHVVGEAKEYDNERWAVGLTSPACATQPRYAVKAISFHAVDESGIDLLGSDESYFMFNAVGLEGTQRSTRSHVFGDIDSGDTASFGAAEGCLYLSCSGGTAPYGIGFSIQLWEHDVGDIALILSGTAALFKKAGGLVHELTLQHWAATALTMMGDGLNTLVSAVWADDLLGSETYAYSPAFLASKLPAAGAAFTETRTYSGASTSGGAEYTMTVAVARVG